MPVRTCWFACSNPSMPVARAPGLSIALLRRTPAPAAAAAPEATQANSISLASSCHFCKILELSEVPLPLSKVCTQTRGQKMQRLQDVCTAGTERECRQAERAAKGNKNGLTSNHAVCVCEGACGFWCCVVFSVLLSACLVLHRLTETHIFMNVEL